jgi:hypothetical protein
MVTYIIVATVSLAKTLRLRPLAGDTNDEDPTEVRGPNMQPLPDHNTPNYALFLSTKRHVRTDKMRLDRFMELATVTSTRSNNLDGHAIVFPELWETILSSNNPMFIPLHAYIIV